MEEKLPFRRYCEPQSTSAPDLFHRLPGHLSLISFPVGEEKRRTWRRETLPTVEVRYAFTDVSKPSECWWKKKDTTTKTAMEVSKYEWVFFRSHFSSK